MLQQREAEIPEVLPIKKQIYVVLMCSKASLLQSSSDFHNYINLDNLDFKGERSHILHKKNWRHAYLIFGGLLLKILL